MKRLLGRFLFITISLLGLLAIGLYLSTQLVIEHYRPQLVAEISDSVGCPVTYSRATIKLTPALEVVLYDAAVMGTDLGFEVTAPYVSAEVQIQALLNRHVDFDRLSLRAPSIVLIASSATTSLSVPPTPSSPIPAQPARTNAIPLPGIKSISIESGRIDTRDQRGQQRTILDDLSINSAVTSTVSTIALSPSSASFAVPVQLRGDVRLPFTASLQQLTYTISPRSLLLNNARLDTGDSSLSVSGSTNLDSGIMSANIQGSNVDLRVIQQVLGVQGFKGRADVQGDLSYDDQKLVASGTSTLKGVTIVARTGEIYGVDSLSGPLSVTYASTQGTQMSSPKVYVRGFSYRDPNVTLKGVEGELDGLSGVIGSDGAAVFSVSLKSTALNLVSGPLTIGHIASAQAPLKITVPATTGYSVAGPVTASGVDLTFHGRPMSSASGSVDMLVSNSVLRFISQNIQAKSNNQALALSGTVEINDTAYNITNIVAKAAGGSLAATVNIKRAPQQQVDAEVLAKGLDVSSAKALFSGKTPESFSGTVDHLSVKATARKDDILASAKGEGVIAVTDGSLSQASFDKRVVGLIKAIPVVGSAVSFSSKPHGDSNYQQLQGGMLKEMAADFLIGGGRFSSKNMKGQGRFMSLQAEGDLTFEGQLNLQASAIYLEQNLKALAGPITPLGTLFGNLGKIEIPLLVTGKVDSPQISADLTRLQDVTMPGRAISPILRGIGGLVDGGK